ncbi:hypothetical protein OHA77_09165 [Streptosporangium sp. NBC_01639]|uniref:hypothetical protein n=1 Tax=Streptosporangium sp. NBC_01639 TaxID=2975948 RepID=UPI0038690298|nr:hypothetical protein OHA77_09165 [Streptosporangium sp. NBC_01639]
MKPELYPANMRRWLGVVIAVVVVMGITGCTPAIGGMTGVSVDAEGHPIIVLAWCDGATPDGVIVYHDEDTSGVPDVGISGESSALPSITSSTKVVDDVRFSAPSLDGQSASVRLDVPTDGWTVQPRPFVMVPGVEYHAFGGRRDNNFSTAHVSFTVGDIAKLKPGVVLLQQYDEKATPGGDWVDVTISQEEFDRQGQERSSCAGN